MISEVFPNLFRIEVPLPRNPLKSLNAYLFRSPHRHLLVDTGMNREECRSVLFAALKELHVDMARTDLFITHLHADHSGLAADLMTPTSRAYASALDGEGINAFGRGERWEDLLDYARKSGFPAVELAESITRHPGFRYRCKDHVPFTAIAEGEVLAAGDYRLTCIETPGHTRGHLCLYDADRKILLSGDHILGDITPNISLFSDAYNPLESYLASLEKMSRYEVRHVLPGHRRLLGDASARIAELRGHHGRRAAEVLAILADGPADGYAVASRMTWDMTYKTFAEFPTPQKWFATGEANAHIRLVEARGFVRREESGDGHIVYRLAADPVGPPLV